MKQNYSQQPGKQNNLETEGKIGWGLLPLYFFLFFFFFSSRSQCVCLAQFLYFWISKQSPLPVSITQLAAPLALCWKVRDAQLWLRRGLVSNADAAAALLGDGDAQLELSAFRWAIKSRSFLPISGDHLGER